MLRLKGFHLKIDWNDVIAWSSATHLSQILMKFQSTIIFHGVLYDLIINHIKQKTSAIGDLNMVYDFWQLLQLTLYNRWT